MINGTGWMWLLGAVALAALVGWFANWLQRSAKRRARRAYYEQAGKDSPVQPLTSAPVPLSGGITPEHAAAIRAHAERRAERDWNAAPAEVRYPYDNGTPEYVLWYATYHLRMGELAEEAEAEAARERKDDVPPSSPSSSS
ncbi:hypothetical protein H8N03_16540 [Ramlibacter sp. USB13]|uniref:Uncharacterized protein n=1 Tax=Ramlibacter cellulosilyticus TaxID=2764187 RepID=A0A923SCR8_9BURK|nr:hypothetical protein [Ramlibacter cellulosilyticus]MBC5784558.1 hypothetical protein [Ramlibacter cellulosilyticus]